MKIDLYTLIVLTYLVGWAQQSCTEAPICFVSKLFNFNLPKQGFYNVSVTPSPNFQVKAYADFNRDLLSDFVSINQMNQVVVYLWNKDNALFTPITPIEITVNCLPTNLFLYDINSDGLLDITVWGITSNKSNNCLIPFVQQITEQQIFFSEQSNALWISTKLDSNPIIFVHRNPPIIGLLLFDTSRIILSYNYATAVYDQLAWSVYFNDTVYQNTPFADRHWNTMIDFTGDCLPDLVIVNKFGGVEFWINFDRRLSLSTVINTTNLTSLSLADTNYDGGVDVIMSQGNKFTLYYNVLPPHTQNDFCRSSSTVFPYTNTSTSSFTVNGDISQQNIHFGDINIDGFPDLLVVENNIPKIYINEAGGVTTFTPSNTYNDIFQAIFNTLTVVGASFYDILENGIVDTFVTVQTQTGYQLYALYNNFLYQNSFFIKGYGASGPAQQNTNVCVFPGISFNWINSVGGEVRMATNSQYTQTAYDALQMPYILSGLGRANNYVDAFTVSKQSDTRSWAPIIPNSQLAILTTGSSSNWDVKIFVLPTEALIYVILVTVVILIILGVVLLIIKYKTYKKHSQNNVDWM